MNIRVSSSSKLQSMEIASTTDRQFIPSKRSLHQDPPRTLFDRLAPEAEMHPTVIAAFALVPIAM